jgi:hypothetical protein
MNVLLKMILSDGISFTHTFITQSLTCKIIAMLMNGINSQKPYNDSLSSSFGCGFVTETCPFFHHISSLLEEKQRDVIFKSAVKFFSK